MWNRLGPSTMDSSSIPSEAVFAILVGIDNYAAADEFGTLRGAVNDAKLFNEFLADSRDSGGLQVPPTHIRFLENRNATRCAILSAFEAHFLNNPAIPDHENTTMIFYFAGHGSRVESPGNILAADGKVEVICPVDERTLGVDGKYVHGIPDYVLGQLLFRLAEKKGNNIIVIMDSCHSGGMGRDNEGIRNAREASRPIPLELDSHLWEDIGTTRPYNIWTSAHSHVLLAACHQNGAAYETSFKPFHGHFTKNLVTELRRTMLEDITYVDLIDDLPVFSRQVPHCGGANSNRLVFRTEYPANGRRTIALTEQPLSGPDTLNRKSRSFLISMGIVEGIRPGTEFYVRAPNNNLLCTLTAQTVDIHQAVLASEDGSLLDIPKGSRAVIKKWKNDDMLLRIYTPDLSESDLFPPIDVGSPHNYVQTDSRETANIVLKTEEEEYVVESLTGPMTECARELRFPLDVAKPLHLPSVLNSISHFYYFLERENGSSVFPEISLAMHRLQGQFPNREPDPSAGINGNLVVAGEVKISSEEDVKYGFTMRNTSDVDLFPYLFHFNPLTYTIKAWYIPESAHGPPPLRASGSVTVGLGGEGAFFFTLPSGKRTSHEFLKMFVSTKYLDLGWIEQTVSPFDPEFEGIGRFQMSREPQNHDEWNALRVSLTITADA
ncbi:hypothetical protein B0H13DRAFT_2273908 [Mycena leptocephala]|nr:hypothetical protein B0H13DRAFT_2273908 [Mycena leptocephala]